MYQWDENKRRSNIRKHGLDFADLEAGFDLNHEVMLEKQTVDGEERILSIGPLNDRLVTMVTVERGEHLRVISLRRSKQTEQKKWRNWYEK